MSHNCGGMLDAADLGLSADDDQWTTQDTSFLPEFVHTSPYPQWYGDPIVYSHPLKSDVAINHEMNHPLRASIAS